MAIALDTGRVACCRDVLVVIDGSPHSWVAVDEASLLAEARNSRLTVLCVRPRALRWLSQFVGAPPHCVPRPSQGDLDKEFRGLLKRAIRRVPEGIPVTSILSTKSAKVALRTTLARGGHDMVVDGTRQA